LLALSVQVYGKPEQVAGIAASAFHPKPRVDSTILRVEVFASPMIPRPLLETFFRLIKAGFAQKRKTLRNSLAAGLNQAPGEVEKWLAGVGIDARRRAETLGIDEWKTLCETNLT
jgi:16S rRNA (adenine1518-N6/adenine1519-N6)-dimethyltransferase